MIVLLLLLIVLLAGALAALATGRLGGVSVAMAPAPERSGGDVLEGAGVGNGEPMTAAHLAAVRFDRAVRGYRMDQVDAVLDRLAEELARRDETIAALRRHRPPGEGAADQEPWPTPARSSDELPGLPDARS